MRGKLIVPAFTGATLLLVSIATAAEGPVIRIPPPPVPRVTIPKPPAPKVKIRAPRAGTTVVKRAPHRYDYYPDSQVYFDPARRLYFFLQANRWFSRALLPPEIKVQLGAPVIIDLDTEQPYDYHDDVVRIYPGRHHESGYRAGFDDGYEEGYGDGYNAAYRAAFDQGYRDGYRACQHDHGWNEEGPGRGRGQR